MLLFVLLITGRMQAMFGPDGYGRGGGVEAHKVV